MGLLDSLMGGLGYAGDVEAKFGGRAIRGMLGGKPREALSVLPFSDSLGITNPEDQVHGSDLAGRLGIARDDDPLARGAMGMGIDIATDPLSYLGGLGAAHHLARGAEFADSVAGSGARNLAEHAGGLLGESDSVLHFPYSHEMPPVPSGETSLARRLPQHPGSMTEQIPWDGPSAWDDSTPFVRDHTPEQALHQKFAGGAIGAVDKNASRFSNLRSLREPFALAKDLGGSSERVIGGEKGLQSAHVLDSAHNVADAMPEVGGAAIAPWANLEDQGVIGGTGYTVGNSPSVSRHEAYHGMVNNAVMHGGEDALSLPGRLSAKIMRAGLARNDGLNFQTGVGTGLSELGAHAAQERGLAEQLKGAAYFAGSPEAHSNYHDILSAHSPMAAAAYHSAPGAVLGGIGGGAVGADEGERRGGLGGALIGGAGGALLGALGGGGLSHQVLSPRGFNKAGLLSKGENLADISPSVRSKADTYGLARVPKKRAVEEAGMTVKPPDSGYSMKPGRPAGRRPSLLEEPKDIHQAPKYGSEDDLVAAYEKMTSGSSGKPANPRYTTAPETGVPDLSKHTTDADLVSAYENMRPQSTRTAGFEDVPAYEHGPSEGAMYFAPDAIEAAQRHASAVAGQDKGDILHKIMENLGQPTEEATLAGRLRKMLFGNFR